MAAQRTTNALMFIYQKFGYSGVNYIDDIGCAEVERGFQHRRITNTVRLNTATQIKQNVKHISNPFQQIMVELNFLPLHTI
jgi:hypothetical protein